MCLAAGEEGLSVWPMDGGDPEGYEAAVARLVARDLSTRLGMDLTLKYVYPTLEERLEYLEQRKCDFMAELLTNGPRSAPAEWPSPASHIWSSTSRFW